MPLLSKAKTNSIGINGNDVREEMEKEVHGKRMRERPGIECDRNMVEKKRLFAAVRKAKDEQYWNWWK